MASMPSHGDAMKDNLLVLPANPLASYLQYREELDAAWSRVLIGGTYVLGPEVLSFEEEFAAYLGVSHTIGVSSGTQALQLALQSLGVGPGDQVFTVSHTAVATVAAIVSLGGEPVFVDIDARTCTMEPNRLEDAIRRRRHHECGSVKRLKAVVPVHLYGHPANMPAIIEIARRYDLVVVEDCAQAHGAAIAERRVGTWGDMAAFSFYPTKNLGCFGDGGAIVTSDERLAAKARGLREYGWNEQRISMGPGANARLDEVQAALLRVKLKHLDADNVRRRDIAHIYDRHLDSAEMQLPSTCDPCLHVYHQYVVRVARRDRLRQYLKEKGIGTLIHYPVPVHRQPAYETFARSEFELTETESAVACILSLPMFPQLTAAQVETVGNAIRDWLCCS